MNFSQIHFCAEEIIERFLRSNWLNEFESVANINFKNRRHGLFKNILISQNDKPRPSKWKKGNHGQWNLTHQTSKGADNKGNVSKEYGYFVQFDIKEGLPIILLIKENDVVSQIPFCQNWQEHALQDFRVGREEYLQYNPGDKFVAEESEYKLYINFLSSLFPSIEDEFEPYYTTYLALFSAYNENGITEKAKTVIETTMGAMIFYMPQNAEESWSKRVSYECFLKCVDKKGYKKVKDHEIPRKLAAKLCLERDEPFNLNEFKEQYWSRFSSFTYVTTEENMRLVNWYIDENNQNDYSIALDNLYIPCLTFNDNFNHRGINKVISTVRESFNVDDLSLNQLEEFINQLNE